MFSFCKLSLERKENRKKYFSVYFYVYVQVYKGPFIGENTSSKLGKNQKINDNS